jgi:hypothetical protein
MTNRLTLTTFTFPTEAHVVKGFLEANGIESYLKDEMTVQVNNFYSNAIGGVKLQVNEPDFERGIQLLKESGYLKEHTTIEEDQIKIVEIKSIADKKICPFCGSDNFGKSKKLAWPIVPVYLLLNIVFPIYKPTYKCFDCDKEWKFKKVKQ